MAVFKYLNANGQWEIIGSTGGDAKEVIKYIPQELTEDQKAQARDNIGAEDIVAINSAIEEAVGDLNTYVAIDEESDGYVELKEFIVEDTIQVDKTLSISGAAADAQVVGDRINSIAMKWINW